MKHNKAMCIFYGKYCKPDEYIECFKLVWLPIPMNWGTDDWPWKLKVIQHQAIAWNNDYLSSEPLRNKH